MDTIDTSDQAIERAVSLVHDEIQKHELCSARVPQFVSVQFYEGLIDRLQTDLAAIHEDMGDDG